jgi:uncharacterized protein (DUF58 family)
MRNYLIKLIKNVSRPEKIYILPTFDGLKLLGLNILLLIIGLTYANNFILLFNFILFCLFLCSMFYTHYNLMGLHLDGIKFIPAHAGEFATIQFFFKSNSKLDHHFIKAKIKSKLFDLEDHYFSFTKSFNNQIRIDYRAKTHTRGVENINHIYLETLFPFHLFRCFAFHPCTIDVVVYPKLNMNKLFNEIKSASEQQDESEDQLLREYQPGDSLTRVSWKKVAQSNQWFSKVYMTPKLIPVTLTFSEFEDDKLEEQLSSMATYINHYQTQGTSYGLSLEHADHSIEQILPGNSLFHFQICLKKLAMYEH